MSRTENTVRNIIWGMLNKVIILLFPFIIRTVIIRQLGSEYLGLSSLFTSLLQVLSLAELGFSSAVVFSLYKPIAEKDKKTICALMNLYKKIYRIIGLIILILGLCVMPFISYLIKGTYPTDINIYLLYFIYLINTVITYFLFAYKSSLLVAHQRNDIISNISSITRILEYILQIYILWMYKNYYMYMVITIFSTIINNFMVAYCVNKKYPDYKSYGVVDDEEKRLIRKRVFGLMIQKVCKASRNSLDSIFLSAFLGLNIVAMYNNYFMILSAITGILIIFITSMTASIGNSIAVESVEKNYSDLKKFNFIYMWISGFCTVCLLCLYQPFMKIWMGEQYLFSMGIVICFCLYFYSLKVGDIISAYTQASGIWWEGRYKAIIETVINIVLNYFLGKTFGVYGILLATIISLSTVGFIYGTSIVFRNYFKNISKKEYYLYHLLYFIITVIIATITFVCCEFVKYEGILGLCIKLLICIIVPNLLYILVYYKTKIFKESITLFRRIIILKLGVKNNEF